MKKVIAGIITALAAFAAFGFGFAVPDLQAGQAPNAKAFAGLMGAQSTLTPAQTYQLHFDNIQRRYTRIVSPSELRASAMDGLVATLGDPHTNYFEPVAAERFTTENRGNFVGIGARLGENALGAAVAAVFESGPAFRSGLKVNDVIVTVDAEKVAGVPVTEIVGKIRGEEGTTVKLGVMRAGSASNVTLNIVRSQVEIPTAEGKMLADNIGFISVSQFTERTPEQFDRALTKVIDSKAQGLIIDLRENPGGLLQSASAMLGNFVSRKLVVSMKMRDGSVKEEFTPGGAVVGFPKPVVILVDENSASAAEIFSGVLRDYKIATLVGEHSYGKTSVQNVHPIREDNASIKVTIAKYFLPSGVNFDRKVDEDGTYLKGGLEPDVLIELPTGEPVVIGDADKDPQLKKAIEVVKQKRTA